MYKIYLRVHSQFADFGYAGKPESYIIAKDQGGDLPRQAVREVVFNCTMENRELQETRAQEYCAYMNQEFTRKPFS